MVKQLRIIKAEQLPNETARVAVKTADLFRHNETLTQLRESLSD